MLVDQVARIDGRWFITGQVDSSAAAWYSDDAITWHAAVVTGSMGGSPSSMGPIAGNGGVLVSLGWSGSASSPGDGVALAWVSRDGGTSWEPMPPPAGGTILRDIAAGPAGFVAISGWAGCCALGTPAAIAVSGDGVTWRTLDITAFGGAMLNAVASDGERYVLVGERSAAPGDTAGALPAAWWSADGVAWSAAEATSEMGGEALIDVAPDSGGFSAIGLQHGAADYGCALTAWSSADGTAWLVPEAQDSWWWAGSIDRLSEPTAVAIDADAQRTIVVAGERSAPGIVWSSDPSGTWWSEDDSLGGTANPAGVALGDGLIVVLSNCPSYATDCGGPSLLLGRYAD